jgi:biopolymer transport protein ExbD
MRRRRDKTGETQGVDLGIIITPMLDMAFQLLAFFIMTYHPPAREAVIDGTLLPAAVAKPGKKLSTNLDAVAKLRVIVKAVPTKKDADQPLQPGQPTSISLERPGQNGKEVVEVKVAVVRQPGAKPDDAPADWGAALKALADELAATLKNPATRNPELTIDADRPLRYGYVIAVREVAEASGYKKIGFNAPR